MRPPETDFLPEDETVVAAIREKLPRAVVDYVASALVLGGILTRADRDERAAAFVVYKIKRQQLPSQVH